ncbi:MAG: hypothetical protein M1839_003738 [Geoglossum umbratile]|nr:MAG: hypothetical protein M1839_003738 [Geoglossum umbratile]
MADEAKPSGDGQSPLHVLIIGAASAGLTIAQGLKKARQTTPSTSKTPSANISFTIFERDASDGRGYRDWGMTVHWSAGYLTKCLPQSILDRLSETQSDQQLDFDTIESFPVHNLETAEILKLVPLVTPRRVSRKRWRKLLMEGLDIQYGKNLKDISYPPEGGVTAHFEDGTTATGTTLIGVDGSKSATRRHLFGEKAALTTLPYIMFNVVVQYSPEHTEQVTEAMHPFCHMGYHPEGTMFWISVMDNPDPGDISKKTYQMVATWPGTLTPEENTSSATRLEVFRNRIKNYPPPFGNFVQWMPDSTVAYPDRIAIWDPLPVDHHGGRVTLAGDAAHNITFHRGQGLNIALLDAADYVGAMVKVQNTEKTLEEAVEEYGKEVLERGTAESKMSFLSTRTVHRWEELMNSPIMKDIGVGRLKKDKDGGVKE